MANKLKSLKQNSVSLNDSSLSIQITQIITQIEFLDSQLFETKLEMANLVTCMPPVTMTIPRLHSMVWIRLSISPETSRQKEPE